MAHQLARDAYHANIDSIGHHINKPTQIVVAVAYHDSIQNPQAKDNYLWVKARRVSSWRLGGR